MDSVFNMAPWVLVALLLGLQINDWLNKRALEKRDAQTMAEMQARDEARLAAVRSVEYEYRTDFVTTAPEADERLAELGPGFKLMFGLVDNSPEMPGLWLISARPQPTKEVANHYGKAE